MNILIAECKNFSNEAARLLSEAGALRLADLECSDIAASLSDVDVLWVRLRYRIDDALLDAAPHLKIIATPTTGLNHIDLEAVRRRGIEIVSLRGESEFLADVRATAEHTIALMLSLLRCVPAAVESVRSGGWNRDLFRGHELYRKTVGIVGYGRLGRIVARYLQAFEVKLLVTDPSLGSSALPIETVLERSDIVTLHVNWTAENNHFFSHEYFERMRRGSWFINTSRGELVDEPAMLAALCRGRLAGAAIDVLDDEGRQPGSLPAVVQYARLHNNLIITPHIGGCTSESMEKTEVFLAKKLLRLLQPAAPADLTYA